MNRSPKHRRAKEPGQQLAIPKATGERIDGGKRPWKSEAYKKHVRTFPCLGCRGPAHHAHHIRECFPRTMGRRITDKYVIPLCHRCHDELHQNAVRFWMVWRGTIGDIFCIDWCDKTHREWSAR